MITFIDGTYKIEIEKKNKNILLRFYERSTLSPNYWYEANKPTRITNSFVISVQESIAIDVLQKSEYFDFTYNKSNQKYTFILNNHTKLLLI